MAGAHGQRSLRFRLLAATLLAVLVALALAGLLLSGLFRDHVMRQFGRTLTDQLDQVTARLEFDDAGQPQLGGAQLSDPRWSRPYSGLYWQIDRTGANPSAAVLRSRSLWDTTLQPPADTPGPGDVHVHEVTGPQGAALLLVERTVQPPGPTAAAWRLMVAADLGETALAIQRFTGLLAAALGALLLLLGAAAVAQVAVGLAPLRALQRALAAVQAGRAQRIDTRFPAEVQPLVDDFNRVLDHNAAIVERARTQAGNLAHAVKTPLAALAQAAAAAQRHPADAAALAARVQDQVGLARRHVDWHLARARAAAAHGLPGVRAAVAPALAGLVRVLERVHAERGVRIDCAAIADDLQFAGEVQDLQEVAGNLIDNACKWARSAVRVQAWGADTPAGRRLHLVVEDDGPGIAPERRAAVMARGARLDESVPGSGLGLAIVSELAGLYGGSVTLGAAASGGLRVEVELPGAPSGT
ncbi:ATP-binding protein [Rubrivivax sp. RP6-9]|uniref:ATP-binding protein n=1 Tax=Rubrivivax sp. RP6-9 TaxID=3415750 RepID=UPI003CC6C599